MTVNSKNQTAPINSESKICYLRTGLEEDRGSIHYTQTTVLPDETRLEIGREFASQLQSAAQHSNCKISLTYPAIIMNVAELRDVKPDFYLGRTADGAFLFPSDITELTQFVCKE